LAYLSETYLIQNIKQMYTKSLVLTLLTAVIHATKIKDTTTNTTDTIKVENPVL